MNKALRVMTALGILIASLSAISGEPYLSDPKISISSSLSASGLDGMTGLDQAGYYSHARQYTSTAKETPDSRSSRSSALRPARTPSFDLSIQDIGRLTLYLNTSNSIRADLVLYQSGDAIFGKGNLTSGSSTREVGVTGALIHDRLALDLVTQDGSLYKLNLQGNGQSISGEYTAINPEGAMWSGSATSRLPPKS